MAGDLHCHTKLSNCSMGIEDLITLAAKKGVKTIAITDQDCQAGAVRGIKIGERKGVTVIPGVELSSTDSKRKLELHILCYMPDSPDRLEGLCHRNVLATKEACQYMMMRLMRKYPLSSDFVVGCASGSTAVYKQHIMHALLSCGFTDRMYGELYDSLFNPDSPDNVIVRAKYSEPKDVINAIHDAGGIAVLAHPGKNCDNELINELIDSGLDGIEVWHPCHTKEQTDSLLAIANGRSILAVGGTDFRGMYSKHPVCVGDYTTPDANLKALLSYKAKLKKQAEADK